MMISGRVSALALFLILIAIVMYLTYQGIKGKKFVLKRSLPAINAIPEAIGRAVEMGRPVHFTPGQEEIGGSRGTQTQMGLVIGSYVTRLCAKIGEKISWSVAGDIFPIAQEIYAQSFIAEGHLDAKVDVRFFPRGAGPFGAGCIETMSTEKSATNIMFGGFGSEFPIMAEGGARVGAFQIGGCSNPTMTPLVVAACDYSAISEEVFVAGAILSENTVQLAGIVALDICKAIIVCLIILGSLLSTVGIKTLIEILKI